MDRYEFLDALHHILERGSYAELLRVCDAVDQVEPGPVPTQLTVTLKTGESILVEVSLG